MLEFRQIINTEELTELQRLRYEIYCLEKHFLPVADYPDGIESDEFDPHSIHFIAVDNDEAPNILGTLRLIRDSEYGFPVESHFSLYQPIEDRHRSVELSRLIVNPSVRKRQTNPILMGLSREAYRYCLAKDIQDCYAVLETPLLRILRRLGLPFEAMGDKTLYFNSFNTPVHLTVSDVDTELGRQNPSFCDYLHAEDPVLTP